MQISALALPAHSSRSCVAQRTATLSPIWTSVQHLKMVTLCHNRSLSRMLGKPFLHYFLYFMKSISPLNAGLPCEFLCSLVKKYASNLGDHQIIVDSIEERFL
jgi:hypothetical protein